MAEAPKRAENLYLNVICNLLIPTAILMKFSSDRWLGPVGGLIAALIFPAGYGIWDFVQRRKTNLFSIIGFASVLLSGGLGLLSLPGIWFAVKDAAVPLILGAGVLISLRTKNPLIKTVLLNDQIIDVVRVEKALDENGQRPAFDRLLRRASFGLAGSFLLVSVLHFFLVYSILKAPPKTEAFNAQLGRVHLYNIPVVMLPSMAALMYVLWQVIKGLEQLTGLDTESIFHSPDKKSAEKP